MHRFRLRLILALIISVTVVSVVTTYFDVLAHRHVLRQELNRQTQWMGISILPYIQQVQRRGDMAALAALVHQERNGTGALALAVYDVRGHLLAYAGPREVVESLNASAIARAAGGNLEVSRFGHAGGWEWLEAAFPLDSPHGVAGSMAIVSDASYIHKEANAVWQRNFWLILILVILIACITAGMVSWSLTRPMSRFAERLRHLRAGREQSAGPPGRDFALFRPIEREVEHMARSLTAARAAAAAEARLRETGEQWWTAERLAAHMRRSGGGSRIFVVSNREPYMHVRNGGDIECMVPPSGLVTALEPVLRACDGVWIAFGSGDADTLRVDEFDRLRVPPDDPQYTLRRVWLSEEEERHYYDGFANEGLWPLCHIAHTRPIFRAADWECYQRINERFARAVIAEMKDSPAPVVFVQDYHFALAPRMIKLARPDARVAIFWHIPWPNPEAFAICPWQNELLDGLLGADLIGFHIPLHCHNFLSTVDRSLEARTSHEQLTISRQGHRTAIRAYPISVAAEEAVQTQAGSPDAAEDGADPSGRDRLLQPYGVHADYLALGVDRLDYTKGILERLAALEQLFEERPWYREKLAFVQIAAPSRTRIAAYAGLRERMEEIVGRINERYQTARWRPVVLIERQCGHEEVLRWYAAADICLVTSLHDGMNLVAKEFVAARGDEDGVLVLSRFTGAAMELPDALLVNPYDASAVAEAIHRGLRMKRAERRERMSRMRRQVMEHNIYLWAASLFGDLRGLRLEKEEPAPAADSGPVPISASESWRRKTA